MKPSGGQDDLPVIPQFSSFLKNEVAERTGGASHSSNSLKACIISYGMVIVTAVRFCAAPQKKDEKFLLKNLEFTKKIYIFAPSIKK
jgi:hypothetical protein